MKYLVSKVSFVSKVSGEFIWKQKMIHKAGTLDFQEKHSLIYDTNFEYLDDDLKKELADADLIIESSIDFGSYDYAVSYLKNTYRDSMIASFGTVLADKIIANPKAY